MKNQNLLDAAKTSFNGLVVLAQEAAFWRELLLVLVAVIALAAKPSGLSAGLLVVSILILALEAMNTAIERLCDLVQPEFDPKIKAIKDVAAAAILIAVLLYAALLLVVVVI